MGVVGVNLGQLVSVRCSLTCVNSPTPLKSGFRKTPLLRATFFSHMQQAQAPKSAVPISSDQLP